MKCFDCSGQEVTAQITEGTRIVSESTLTSTLASCSHCVSVSQRSGRRAGDSPDVRARVLRSEREPSPRVGPAAAAFASLRAGLLSPRDPSPGRPFAAGYLQKQRRRAAASDPAAPLSAVASLGGAGDGDSADRGGAEVRRRAVHRRHSLSAVRFLGLGIGALADARGGAASSR